uniref:Sensory neuron membrane protein 2-like n=1 Tax=Hirondellea gigas TaxID=1518452 RepID=A0A2P2HXX4_9CRUS
MTACSNGKVHIAAGIGLGIVMLILMCSWYPIYNSIIDSVLVLGEDKDVMEMFTTPPIPIYMKFYMFNVLNPTEAQYYGEKPKLEEIGPYVYEEVRTKFNMDFSEDEKTIRYLENKTYFFREDLSNGLKESDKITTVNMVMVLMAAMTYDIKYIGLVWPEIEATMNVFNNYTVGEALFEGWDLPVFNFNFGDIPGTDLSITFNGTLLDLMEELGVADEDIPAPIRENKIGYYTTLNYTDDGPWEVYTGKGDISEYLNIAKWNNSVELDYWNDPYCDMINGTDGTQFPPRTITEDSTVRMFVTELCRSLYLEFDFAGEYFGVDYLRFVAPVEMLQSPTLNPNNKCFSSTMGPLPSSLLEMTPCMGIPLVMSTPHFYLGDGDQLSMYEGLKPEKDKHDTFLDIQTTLGVPLRAHKRIQLNVPLRKYGNLTSFMNFDELYFPIFWADETATMSEEDTAMMKKVLTVPNIIVYTVGGILMAVALVLVYVGYRRHKQQTATV